MKGPLDGIKVVEITMFQQGPVAGMRLGDLGADVIKIEAPGGDPARGFMSVVEAMTGKKGDRNYYFEHGNRNKRSIVLDLKTEKGREIALRLIDKADVFLNNMSISAPARIGLGPEDLMKRNPRLIYAHASGWGRKGPDAKALSFDYTGIGRSGLMMSCGEQGDAPSQILPGIGDELGAIMCGWAVTAALYAREKTGKGQVVDTSLMSGVIGALAFIMAAPAIWGQEFPREVRAKAGNPIYNHYRCKDGKWLIIAHLVPDKYWPKICKALDIQNMENDPKFNSVQARGKNAEELVSVLDSKFAEKDREEWFKILGEEECIFAPVQTPGEVVNDPQALANNYFINFDHPEWGTIKTTGFPWDFSDTPPTVRMRAPKLGEHTNEILSEIGFSEEEIAGLRREKIIGHDE